MASNLFGQCRYFCRVLTCFMAVLSLAETTLHSVQDLWDKYGEIFPHGNRNAASHRWASYILERSHTMSDSTFLDLFASFCAISGSPVQAADSKRWQYSLPKLGGGSVFGVLNHCCWPCVCDSQDFVKVDTKTVTTLGGAKQFNFVVIGNPCVHAEMLPNQAPDVNCRDGQLENATLSDHRQVIIGMIFEGGPAGQDSSLVDQQCKARAASGYNSGMGQIFRQVAGINPILDASTTAELVSNSPSLSRNCHGILSQAEEDVINRTISENAVVIFGIEGMRCTEEALQTLESRSICINKTFFLQDSATLSYFRCVYPLERVGSVKMHSYIFIGGYFVGNGFRFLLDSSDPRCTDGAPTAETCLSPDLLEAKLQKAGASRTCQRSCSGILPADGIAKIDQEISSNGLVLYGWAGCPCTGLARSRFQERGVCYVENVWSSPESLTMKYLQCRYGKEHHSFVWAKGEFVGNGFIFDPQRMSSEQYTELLSKSGATVGMCQAAGDLNLHGQPLQSCTQEGDGTTTGWTRTGSCVWDPLDGGYHQVCVSMTQKFLKSSKDHDQNDLSSVVAEGGHWCICAWAWASAVSRDPYNMEGITIDCGRTNGRLRQVYELHIREGTDLRSPSGAYYKAKNALDALNRECPQSGNMTMPSPSADPYAMGNSATISTTQVSSSHAGAKQVASTNVQAGSPTTSTTQSSFSHSGPKHIASANVQAESSTTSFGVLELAAVDADNGHDSDNGRYLFVVGLTLSVLIACVILSAISWRFRKNIGFVSGFFGRQMPTWQPNTVSRKFGKFTDSECDYDMHSVGA